MKILIFFVIVFSLANGILGCASHPVIMEVKDVKVSRENAKDSCQDMGPVAGKLIGTKPNLDLAVLDMKKEAAAKGANFVKIESASVYGTAVRGQAFFCP